MLQTALLEPFLVQKTEEQNREETVKDCIDKIRPVNEVLGILEEYKSESFFQKIKASLKIIDMWICIVGILFFGGLSIYGLTQKKLPVSESIAMLLSILIACLCLFVAYDIFRTLGLNEAELIQNEEENKTRIISLFSALSDKKFEIRGELLENCSKLKLIVEENQYIDGTTSVIKNSSKSLTAYINMTESKDFIIKSIVSVVKESERKFS
jgi:hypothetical protein